MTERMIVDEFFGKGTTEHPLPDEHGGLTSFIEWYLSDVVSLEWFMIITALSILLVLSSLLVVVFFHSISERSERSWWMYSIVYGVASVLAVGAVVGGMVISQYFDRNDTVREAIDDHIEEQVMDQYAIEHVSFVEEHDRGHDVERMIDMDNLDVVEIHAVLEHGAVAKYGIRIINDEVVLFDLPATGHLPAVEELMIDTES